MIFLSIQPRKVLTHTNEIMGWEIDKDPNKDKKLKPAKKKATPKKASKGKSEK